MGKGEGNGTMDKEAYKKYRSLSWQEICSTKLLFYSVAHGSVSDQSECIRVVQTERH